MGGYDHEQSHLHFHRNGYLRFDRLNYVTKERKIHLITLSKSFLQFYNERALKMEKYLIPDRN